MSRPRVAPHVLASFTDAAPSRLIKKLDRAPSMADSWSWTAAGEDQRWSVVTESGETVTLSPGEGGVISSDDQVGCSCLLAPRCLHVLATLSSLSVDDGVEAETVDPAPDAPGSVEAVELTSGQERAATALYRVGARLLDSGATSAGAVMQAELLRAVHECRGQGLHRAAATGLRVLRAIRDLREERPEFALESLADDLRQVLETTWMLRRCGAGQTVAPMWIGTARRVYRRLEGGGAQLTGLFSEPVVAGSGYAGVVTFLCDRRGIIYTVSDVIPGEASRAAAAYDAGLRIGDATLSHRALARRGLFIQDGTASTDGRLGAGAEVKAVARGATSWRDEGPRRLWSATLAGQLERARAAMALPPVRRPAGSDLLFLAVTVEGLSPEGLIVTARPEEDGQEIALSARVPSDHEVLAYRDNARQLGRAPGLRLEIIGRVRLSRPRSIDLLAAGPAEGASEEAEPALRLPPDWGGRVNLGVDKLQGAHVAGGRPAGPELAVAMDRPPDPTASLRRRVDRLVLGGRATVPASALRTILREAKTLEAAMMPTAARLLRALGETARHAERSIQGTRGEADPEALARAWLAASTYERAATLELQRLSWL